MAIDQDSTRPNYVSGFMHFKAWACATLAPGKNNRVPVEEQVINEDEVGREIGKDLGKGWRATLLNEEHLHGPWTSKWRLQAYVEYMLTETDEQVASLDTGRTRVAGWKPKKCTPPMMLLYLPTLCRRCVDPHCGSLDDVYMEEQFRILVSDILPHWAKVYFGSSMAYLSLPLWKALAVRVMILMAHHMLGKGISIRTIRYCNMFAHVLLPITNSPGESSILVLVVAYRNSKTAKDNKLGHLYLTRHMDFQQCGFGAVFLWLHFLFDLVPLY
ncbi:unnamed protein product [Closterium sp. NIES-53]